MFLHTAVTLLSRHWSYRKFLLLQNNKNSSQMVTCIKLILLRHFSQNNNATIKYYIIYEEYLHNTISPYVSTSISESRSMRDANGGRHGNNIQKPANSTLQISCISNSSTTPIRRRRRLTPSSCTI